MIRNQFAIRDLCGCLAATVIMFSLPMFALSQDAPSAAREGDSGIVTLVDQQGQRLEGVEVWQLSGLRGKKLAAGDGEVQIDRMSGVLIVRKSGLATTGTVLSGKSQIELVLRPVGTPGRKLKTLEFPLKLATARSLESALAERFRNQWNANPNDISVVKGCSESLAYLDPAFVKQKQQEASADSPMLAEMMQSHLVTAYGRQGKLQEATEIIESTDNLVSQVRLGMVFLTEVPPDVKGLKSLETALLRKSRQVNIPVIRLAALGVLAKSWLDRGDTEAASKLIQRYLPEVEQLPAGGMAGYVRGKFAELIIGEQPDQALALIAGVDQRDRSRTYHELALAAAPYDVSLAGQLVAEDDSEHANQMRALICHQIAATDREAATKMARAIESEELRAWSLGLVALQLAARDTDQAQALLEEAFGVLETTNESAGMTRSRMSATMAGLLAISEQVAPRRTGEYLWRSIYFAMPKSRWGSKPEKLHAVFTAAAGVARFDAEIAAAMLPDTTEQDQAADMGWPWYAMFADPKSALRVVEDYDVANQRSDLRFAQPLGGLFRLPDQRCWDSVTKSIIYHWPADRDSR